MEEEEKVVKDVKTDTKIDIPLQHEVKPSSPSNGEAPAAEAKKQSGYLRLFLGGLVILLSLLICVPFVLLYLLCALGAKVFFGKDILADPDNRRRFFERLEATLVILICVPFVLLYLLYALGAKVFFGKDVLADQPKKGGGSFQKAQDLVDEAFRLAKLAAVIRNQVLLFILLWLIINLSVAGLRNKNLLGSKLWKWTLLIVILSCGYHAINMVFHICLFFLELICEDKKGKKGKKEVVYYARGLRRSINLVIFSCMLLLIWLFYFRSDHGLKQTAGSDKVFDLGTRTLISLLIFALLWLLKRILLLKWEAHVVYKRFLDRISRAGFQLYFLALISGKSWDIFRPEGKGSSKETQEEGDTNDSNSALSGEVTIPEGNMTDKLRKAKGSQENYEEYKNGAEDVLSVGDQQKQEEVPNNNNNVSSGDGTIPDGNKPEKQKTTNGNQESHEENKKRKKRAKDILHVEEQEHMLSKNVSTYAIQQMAKYFVALVKVSSREGGDFTTGIFAKFPRDHDYVTERDLSHRFNLDDEEMKLLYKQLQDGKSEVSYEMLKDWVMKALNNCLTLGQTLDDAKEVVNCLNNILNCFVFAMFILSWLLLTEIATTKVLVLIASPLLAASFIFGDTCKTMFEGIIFAFIKHPFDVGDLCVIDETEMEVKQINILTTTFLRLGTKEEALYPNLVLAGKAIINLKDKPDPNDTIELSLDCSTRKTVIDDLRMKIKEYIEKDDGKKFRCPKKKDDDKDEDCGHATMKQIGNSIKIVVHFTHKMSNLVTHSQCSEKKNKQRSEFLLQIKHYLDELNIKLATA